MLYVGLLEMYKCSFYVFKFIITTIVSAASFVGATDIFGLKGGTVTFVCPFKGQINISVNWYKVYINGTQIRYSIDDRINNQTIPPDIYTRLSIVANPSIREYNLQIRDIRESDEGQYRCTVNLDHDNQTLYLIVPPSTVRIENTQADKLLGTEGQDLMVSCVALGGNPPPIVKLQVNGNTLNTGTQTVTYKFPSINRSDDRKTVMCEASNEANVNKPEKDSAVLYLNLKPLQPIFSSELISTEETKPLVASCTSTGSRPTATFEWSIDQTTITSGITTTPVYNNADETYTVTSTLIYSVDRRYNGKPITCSAFNNVSTSGVLNVKILDVKFAPNITVTNTQSTATRSVTCIPVGNPTTYTYYRWQHKSTYGVLIRELDGGQDGVLTLPSFPEEVRYQDSGEYVCTVSNGITGRNGKIQQTGSGYVIVNAQPVFTSGNNDTEYGEFKKSVDIHVYVYSVPKYTSVQWYQSSRPLQNGKFSFSESSVNVTDTFHGKELQVDGYKLTLTIKDLLEPDLNVNYTVNLFSTYQPAVYNILLVSASAPETPLNFTVLSFSESSILVQWQPGYNGGHEQTFYVEYRQFGSNMWVAVKIVDTKQTRQTYTLNGLQDGTSYELRMYAANKFNKSLPTDTIKTNTENSQPFKPGPIIGGVAGGLSAVIVAIVILWFLIFKRKQGTSTTSKIPRSRSDSEIPEGLQHNILYQSAGPDFKPLVPKAHDEKVPKKTSISDTEYAEVQKPNAVYAEVDKTVKQKNAEEKKQKDKKKRTKKSGKKVDKAQNNNQNDEYTNSGLPLENIAEGEYANEENRKDPAISKKNQQGLEYADLSFSKQILQKGKKYVIHGEEDRTLYSEVDHSKKAPPPPQESAYEETNFKNG